MGKLSKLPLLPFTQSVALEKVVLDTDNIEKSLKSCAKFISSRKKQNNKILEELESLLASKNCISENIVEVSGSLKKLEETFEGLVEKKELEIRTKQLFEENLQKLTSQIAKYKKSTQDSQKSINEILSAKEKIESEVSHLQFVAVDEKAKNSFYEKRLREVEAKHRVLKSSKESLGNEAEKLRLDSKSIEKKKLELEKAIKNLSSEKFDLETSISNLKVRMKESEHQSYELKNDVRSAKEEVALLNGDLKAKKLNYNELKEAYSSISKEAIELTESKKSLIGQVSDLEKDIHSISIKLADKKIDQNLSFNELNDLSQKLSILKRDKKNSLDEIKEIKITLERYSVEKVELKKKAQDYRRFLLEAHDLNEGWKIKFKKETKKHDEVVKLFNIEKEKFDKINNEYLTVRKNAEICKKDYLRLENEIAEMQESRNSHIEKIYAEKESIQRIKKEVNKFREQRTNAVVEIKKYADLLFETKCQKEEVSKKWDESKKVCADLERQKEGKRQTIQVERRNIEFMQSEIKKVEEEKLEIIKRIENIDKKIELEGLERSRTKNILAQSKNKLSQTLEERLKREKVFNQVVLATNDVKENVDRVHSEIHKHQGQIDKLSDEINLSKKSVLEMNKIYNQKREECIRAQKILKELSEKIISLKSEKKMREESSVVMDHDISNYKNKILMAKERLQILNQEKSIEAKNHSLLAAQQKSFQEALSSLEEKINMKEQEISVVEMRDRDYLEKTNRLQNAIDAKKREFAKLEEKLKSKRKNTSDHAYITSSLERALTELDGKIASAKEKMAEKAQLENQIYLSDDDAKIWSEFSRETLEGKIIESNFQRLTDLIQDQEFDNLEINHHLSSQRLSTLSGVLTIKNLATRAHEIKMLVRPFAKELKENGISIRLKTQLDKNQVCKIMTLEWERIPVQNDLSFNQIN